MSFARILSRILCFFGIHDWREMDGHCRECGKRDTFWDK